MFKISDQLTGRWVSILTMLGVDEKILNSRRHHPCPGCGGKDRFRFTNYNNKGGYICSQCGNGDGFQLLDIVFGWDFKQSKEEIEKIYTFYKAKFPKMISSKINQIDLLKYSSGGKYDVHTDQATSCQRHLSIIINLNDKYVGGDLIFTDQKGKEIKKLKLDKGSIVFFPSNFMYPHSIEPITKGTRYSIVAWLQ